MAELAEVLETYSERVRTMRTVRVMGVVRDVIGSLVESEGPAVRLGDLCEIEISPGVAVRTQVIGFRGERVLSMPLDEVQGLRPGLTIHARDVGADAPTGPQLLGRVIDGLGNPIDGAGPLLNEGKRALYADPPGPMERQAITTPLVTGVRVLDGLLPCGLGQRIGLFGGSGVGKSTLLGALARNSSADVNVIALIGERNREVRGFVEESLREQGLARSVVVAATSDRPAPVRVRASFLATAIAESFAEQGRNVLLVMDSVTRFAMAQREIGLAAGEPPSQKGYTPSVFQLLPRLFERAGNFKTGSITAMYSVLVEGDDMNEPIADACRAILDGHIVLSRDLASAGHFPPIDVLASVSRLAERISSPEQRVSAARLRETMAAYRATEDLINLGAYTSGSNPVVDSAIKSQSELREFLRQDLSRDETLESTVAGLQALVEKL
ncbi:MAG: FliI/YscN family ATPase [Acidobacteria bacterium]|nr:FliI/YscN family ATPase [Acidobacteriota bacterium]